VLVIGDGGLVEYTADPGEDGLNIHFSDTWAALMWPTESLHFIGRAAPAALLFQNGLHDTNMPPDQLNLSPKCPQILERSPIRLAAQA